MWKSRIVIFAALVFLAGCPVGRHVGQGMEFYQRGQLDLAKTKFESIESFKGDLNAKGYLRYLVYRGLTHYDLGEMSLAKMYLAQGRVALQRSDARWLPPNIIAKMNAALDELES